VEILLSIGTRLLVHLCGKVVNIVKDLLSKASKYNFFHKNELELTAIGKQGEFCSKFSSKVTFSRSKQLFFRKR
jgi:hypothetical protein